MADVYQIAMELGLQDKATEGLRNITESLHKLTDALERAHAGLGRLGVGMGLLAAGSGMALGLVKLAEGFVNVEKAMTRMSIAGMDAARAMRAVDEVGQIRRGVTREESLARLNMMYGFVGQAAYGQLLGGTKAAEMLDLAGDPGGLKAIYEIATRRGLTRPGREKEFEAFREQMVKMVQATGGEVTPEKLENLFGRGGIQASLLSPEMLNTYIPALMLGGRAAGRMGPTQAITALGQLTQDLRSGKSHAVFEPAFQAAFGVRMGRGDVAMMQRDPAEWANLAYRRMQAEGRFTGDPTKDEAYVYSMMQKVFRNPQVAQLMASFMMMGTAAMGDKSPFVEYQKRVAAAGGTSEEALGALDKTTYEKLKEIGKAWKDMTEEIGKADKDSFNWVLDHTRDFLDTIAKFAKEHPAEFDQLSKAIAGLSSVLIAAGIINMAMFILPSGAWILGALGLVAGIDALSKIDWKENRSIMENLYANLYSYFSKIKSLVPGQGPAMAPPATMPAPGSGLDVLGKWWKEHFGLIDRPAHELPGGRSTTPSEMPPSIIPQSFTPGRSEQKDVNLSLTLAIDGQTIAQSIWRSLAKLNNFPIGGSAGNYDSAYSTDMQYRNA